MNGAPAGEGFRVRLRALVRKEFRQLWRDPSNLAIGLALPAVLILLFGYGISLDVKDVPVAIVLEDASPAALTAVSGLQRSPYFHVSLERTMRAAEDSLQAHRIDAILRLPADFSRDAAAGQAHAQLIVQGVDAATARVIEGYVTGALAQPLLRMRSLQGPPAGVAGAGAVVPESRLWFNEANTSTWYLVPGLIVLIMTLTGAFLTSLVVAREWERGTLEALFVTPVRPGEILLAKLLPHFAVGMVGFAMCLLAARFLFHVPFVGSLWLLCLSSVLYMLVSLGVGLLISSATKNQFIASQLALLTSFLPAMMLSGFLFDLNNVPAVVRVIGRLLPATHFLDLLKTLLLAGNVWPIVLRDCAILTGYAIVLLTAARLVTRKRLA